MTMQDGTNKDKPARCTIPRCTFAGGDGRGGFTGEQLRYPCKLRRHICARCGMHRGEHSVPNAGVRDHLLPPRKRSAFRRLVESQLPCLGGGGEKREAQVLEEGRAASAVEEGQSWTGSAITKGKRRPRKKRADMMLLCCEMPSLNE